jgi:hypothetical protein
VARQLEPAIERAATGQYCENKEKENSMSTYEYDLKHADNGQALLELLHRTDIKGWEPVGFWRTGNGACDEYEVLLKRPSVKIEGQL